MCTLFHCSEANGVPDANYSALQRETCQLISKYCQQFGLDEDVEFACFELTHRHFKNVQNKILDEFHCADGSPVMGKSLDEYIQQAMFTFELDLPLNLFSIISITAKYFDSKNWIEMFKVLPKILQSTGKIVSFRELYQTEFKIFRDLDFCVSQYCEVRCNENEIHQFINSNYLFLFQIKRSPPYQTLQTILEHCSINISPTIFQLHPTCITILRFTYVERQTIYKK